MLFIPQSIYDSRRRLWADFNEGTLAAEVFYRNLLDLDPDDVIGLVGIARVHRDAGDIAQAEAYYWRAIQANPCESAPYVDLARMLNKTPESRSLAMALGELAVLKKSREEIDESPFNDVDFDERGLRGEVVEQFKELPAAAKGALIAASMLRGRPDEPGEITERLRHLRMIEQVQQAELDAKTVDAIIAEGVAIVPLLIGIVRAWAQDFLGEDGDVDLENALALLGETASPSEIPWLLELIDLENTTAAGASDWALERIVKRHPGESAKLIASIAAGLGMAARLKVAEQTLTCSEFDPAGKLLERLSENLEPMEKDDRDVFFRLLLITMAMARGRAGVSLGRAVLRRQSSLLSRNTRRECEELLASCEEDSIPKTLARPSPLTVYDICAGEADWDEAAEGEEEPEDDFLPPPEPIRRAARPGRNDPCWCNSGKKYKKCHLDSDEQGSRQIPGGQKAAPRDDNEFVGLRKNIGEFLGQVLPQREMKQAILEFFDGGPQEIESEIPVIDWMIHDRVSPSLGGTVLEEFLERRPRLTAREREMVEAWSRSYVGLYEVQSLKAGVGAELRDLILGETFFAHDVSMSTRLAKWDGLLARVVPGERGTELAGSALTVPRTHLEQLREWLDDDRDQSGLEWRKYLKCNWPRIRRQSLEIAANWAESLRLANTDGEELLFSRATYRLADEVAAISALQLCAEFEDNSREDKAEMCFVWLNGKKTVLGNLRVASGEITLECNSKERLERGKRLLADSAGDSIRHLRDDFTTQSDMKRQMKTNSRPSLPSEEEIPKEVRDEIATEALEQHYSKWLDTKLPALHGKTPRQATKTAKGREELAEVLKFIENGEERKRQRGETFYNVARLWAELGMNQ